MNFGVGYARSIAIGELLMRVARVIAGGIFRHVKRNGMLLIEIIEIHKLSPSGEAGRAIMALGRAALLIKMPDASY